jgi:hypothetical protein
MLDRPAIGAEAKASAVPMLARQVVNNLYGPALRRGDERVLAGYDLGMPVAGEKRMKIVATATEFDREIQRLLERHGCALVSTYHLAIEARACREEIHVYDIGAETIDREAFFHYIVADGVAIFLFDGDPFLVYVFPCNPHELITHVESEFTMEDVEDCKHYVSTVLGRRADIAVSSEIAYRWMQK